MGNVCTSVQQQNAQIECPHRKYKAGAGKQLKITTEINQRYACSICQQLREMKNKNQEWKDKDNDNHSIVSISTQNVDELSLRKTHKKIKTNQLTKKTIHDFEVIRGLGRGAFGKVYLIKQRENTLPMTQNTDIMSLDLIKDNNPDNEIPEEINLQEIFQNHENKEFQDDKQSKKSRMTIHNEQTSASKSKMSKMRSAESKIYSVPKYYALKILNKKQLNSEEEKKKAVSERYILETMNHPFIVKLHYAFQTTSRLFLIVDLLQGGQLFYLLRKMRKFDEEQAKFYAAEILLALQYLHQKCIIYRDLKPQNILLDAEGHIKITDFGLSKVMYSSSQKTYSLCGTPEYIAPEVIKGTGYTQAADWFSFGSLIYDMLTGRPPFLNNNKSVMLKNIVTKSVPLPYYISDKAKSLLNGLFNRNPEQRLGSKQGAAEIKRHKFFEGIDFTALYNRKMKPPINFQQRQDPQKDEFYLNSGGFQKWNSWYLNMESPSGKHTKHGKENLEGFTYADFDFQINEQDETPIGQDQEVREI